jgi:cell division protein FtsW (lipid II flippase)
VKKTRAVVMMMIIIVIIIIYYHSSPFIFILLLLMLLLITITITITSISITIKIIRLHCDSRPAPQREVFSTWEMPWRKPRATPATGFLLDGAWGIRIETFGEMVFGLIEHWEKTLGKG